MLFKITARDAPTSAIIAIHKVARLAARANIAALAG